MKKILLGLFTLSSMASFAMGKDFNIYTKVGVDAFSRYTKIVERKGVVHYPSKGKIGTSLFLEGTKNITHNFESGLGIGYIHRKDNAPAKSSITIYKIDEEAGTKEKYLLFIPHKYPRYKSFPLYATAKYNFDLGYEVKPYIKADLGYSFNKINKSKYSEGLKIKNGLYTALSVGAEYNNFLAELSYTFSKAKLKDGKKAIRYNHKSIRLSVGYKFNF